MKTRNIDKAFAEALRTYPVLAVTGPRQSGKTTLLQQHLKDYKYISLEDRDARAYASKDPKSFLDEFNNKIILDEVQYVPQLFSYIQTKTDKDKIMGQYILSGSQNFNLMENITQSLAGRVSIFRLLPFDLEEMKSANWLGEDLGSIMTTGFYPAIFQREMNPDKYYANYINTYVERDVSQLKNIQDQDRFRRFLKLCATRAGQQLNYNDLSRDAGISHTTVRDWLSVLETSYIVYTMNPYYRNYSKRIVKSSKLYFYDVGILCHLLNIRRGKLDPIHPMWGNIFENFIVSEYHKRNYHNDQLLQFYYWQDSNKNEIDLLFQENLNMTIAEIKSSTTIRNDMFTNLNKFERISGENIVTKRLIYGGNTDQKRTEFDVRSWHNPY